MNKIYGALLTRPIFNTVVCRNISRSVALNGGNKTTVNVLNKELELGLMIDSFSEVGFRLNNNFSVIGPLIIFRRSVLSWNVADHNDINEASLSLFSVLEPKLDILILGIGDKLEGNAFYHELLPFSKKLKISFDISPTEHACATFNFLNAEGRNVAAALIPPKHIRVTTDDEIQAKLRQASLYDENI